MKEDKKDDLVEVLKQKLSIGDVLSHFGHIRNPTGNWECVFHTSKGKHSLIVNEVEGWCDCCDSNCSMAGDIFSVIGLHNNLECKNPEDFKQILKMACEMAGIDYKQYRQGDTEKIAKDRRKKDIITRTLTLFYQLSRQYFPLIVSFVREKRNLTAEEEKQVDLGYIPPDKLNNIKQIIKSKIPESSEVFYLDETTKKKKYLINTFNTFSGRIIYGHKSPQSSGNIIYLTGGKTPNSVFDPETKYTKLNTHFSANGHAEAYFLESLYQRGGNILFLEGFEDIRRANSIGFNSLGFGTNRVSQYFIEKHYYRLKSFKKVIVCFDSEKNSEGLTGATNFCKKLLDKGVTNLFISELPLKDKDKVDIDDYIGFFETMEEKRKAIENTVIKDTTPYIKYILRELKNIENEEKQFEKAKDLVEVAENLNPLSKIKFLDKIKEILKITDSQFKKVFLKEEKKEIEEKKEVEKIEINEDTDNEVDDKTLTEMASALNFRSPAVAFAKLAEIFLSKNPYYFDTKNKRWWGWNPERTAWEIQVETDILRIFKNEYEILEWIEASNRVRIMKAIEVIADKKPKVIPIKWIHFKNCVYDLDTDKEFIATPEFFYTSPLPYNLGNSEETPTIDKLFEEWVGDKKDTLFEMVAYTMYRNYPIAKVFFLYGTGRNGKGQFSKTLTKFIGKDNIASTKIDKLSGDSRFEVIKCRDKLLVLINEPDNEGNKPVSTGILKELSGGDRIGGEIKGIQELGQNLFENFAKLMVLTNHYPVFNDNSIGWINRVFIVDFNRYFLDTGKEVYLSIPDTEFENLGRKSIRILKKLLETGKFTNEDSYEEKKKKIKEKSGIIEQFIDEMTEEDENAEEDLDFLLFNLELFCKERNVTPPTRKHLKNYIQKNILKHDEKIKRSTKIAKFQIQNKENNNMIEEINATHSKKDGKMEDIRIHIYNVRGLRLNYPVIHFYPLFSIRNSYIVYRYKTMDKSGYVDNNFKNIFTIENFKNVTDNIQKSIGKKVTKEDQVPQETKESLINLEKQDQLSLLKDIISNLKKENKNNIESLREKWEELNKVYKLYDLDGFLEKLKMEGIIFEPKSGFLEVI